MNFIQTDLWKFTVNNALKCRGREKRDGLLRSCYVNFDIILLYFRDTCEVLILKSL